ncbi:MAG: PKD domain-containing protein, partial [Euryarchaeota archaeon]|nr:PKD domain-containing protein [Euryarchaeota archaeon]
MNKRILNDERAVSGLVGEIMLIGVVIVAIGLITVSTYSYLNKDADPPHIEVNGLVNIGQNEIHLKHQGGESIEGENLRVLVSVNSTTLDPFDEDAPNRWGLRENGIGNFDRWTLGKILVLDTWPTILTEDDDIRVTIVDCPSNRVVVSGEVFGGLFGNASINRAPIADAGDDQTNGLCENTAWAEVWVHFNGSGSYDPDNPTGGIHRGIVSWQWDFDDGNESDVLDAPYVSHNYSVNGTYDVELTVTDVDGATGSDSNPLVGSRVCGERFWRVYHDSACVGASCA